MMFYCITYPLKIKQKIHIFGKINNSAAIFPSKGQKMGKCVPVRRKTFEKYSKYHCFIEKNKL